MKPINIPAHAANEVEPAAQPLQSVRPRDNLADELRGFALLGIVTVNAPFIGISAGGFTDTAVAGSFDRAVAFMVVALAQAKFYLLFSFLFGYSMSYLLKDNAITQRRAFRRRLLGLGVLGILHGTLFFAFDILLLYAILGFVLLALAARSDRTVLLTAAASAVVWCLVLLVLGSSGGEAMQSQRESQMYFSEATAGLKSSSFWLAVKARVNYWLIAQLVIAGLNGFAVFALFCIGLVAGRAQLLRKPERHLRWWRLGFGLGLVIGLPGALLSATWIAGYGASFDAPAAREAAGVALGFVTAPALSLAYVCAMALLHIRKPNLLKVFRPAGRMSLTGYISESALLALIFCGFGVGLMGQLGAAAVTGIALAVWLTLDVFAQLWQKQFVHGPLEYLLSRWSRPNGPAKSINTHNKPPH
jgi:uncharacterized protein